MNDYNFFLKEEDYSNKKFSKSNQWMEESLDTLYEDIYLGNTSQLKEVDDLFDQLIILTDKEKGLRNSKPETEKILNKITKIINKMFNIKMNFTIDFKRNRTPVNVAYTIYSKDIADIFENDIEEIVINEKTGYQMLTIKEVNVAFENAAMRYFKYPELANSKKEFPKDLTPITGRALTSILLHELGHNVFIPFYFSNDVDFGKYEFKVKNLPPIIVYKDKFKNQRAIAAFIAFVSLFLLCMIVTPYTILFAVFANTYYSSKHGMDNYMRNEKNANVLPLQYGYGEELFENTVRIKWIQDGAKSLNLDFIRRFFKRRGSEYQSIITRDIIDMMNEEIKNTNNAEAEIEYLKELKKTYIEKYKKLQDELAIYGDRKIEY